MYTPEFADVTTLRDGLVNRNVMIGIDRAINESQSIVVAMYQQTATELIPTCQNGRSHFIVDELITPTPKIEQAKDSISPYKANLEAAGLTDLQDVNLCSGRETWGCPPGGVCPRKVMHEDIKPWFTEHFANKMGVSVEFLEQVLSRALPGDIIGEEDN